MSQFVNVVFPQIACKTVRKEEIYLINEETDGVASIRSSPFDSEFFRWVIPSYKVLEETKLEILAFLRQRRFTLQSFKFVDPNKPELVDNRLPNLSGTVWKVTLAYDDAGTIPGVHPIFHPDTALWTIKKNGTPVSGSFSTATGFPLLTIAGSVPSDVITISGPVYWAVKLESTFGWQINTLTAALTPETVEHTDIILREVFEY